MKTNNNIPAYRFQGYTDAWELRKLGEVGYAKSGVGFPEKEQGGTTGIPFFKVSDMNTNGNENELVVANNYVTDEQISKRKWRVITEVPAIFFAKVGAAVMLNRKRLIRHPFLLDNNTMTYVFNHTQWDTNFGKTLFETIDLTQLTQVGALPSYNSSDVENIKISLPSHPEQSAIGTFFSTLDQHITLHQRKLDTLKEQKKTYLKLLFPAKGQTQPALRFRGFEDDWEEVKLGEVLIKNSKRNKDLRIINVESVSNRLGFVKQTEQFEDYSVASSDLSNYYVISEKQFAYNPSRINVGSIAYKKLGEESSVVSPLYVSFSTSENVEDYYLWYWFKTELFHSQRIVFSEGGVRDTLSYNQLSEIILSLPSLPEQEVIGTFFQTLDQEIAQVEDKLASLKEMKKTLLRKLFV